MTAEGFLCEREQPLLTPHVIAQLVARHHGPGRHARVRAYPLPDRKKVAGIASSLRTLGPLKMMPIRNDAVQLVSGFNLDVFSWFTGVSYVG